MMKKEEIITALKELNAKEFSKDLIAEGKSILESYQLAMAQSHKEQKEKHEADGGIPAEFVVQRDEHDSAFDELWAAFSKAKKDFKTKLAEVETNNLKKKEAILEKINALKNHEHIKQAHDAFKELEKEWKEIGRIPQDKIKEIDNKYSVSRDEFFYNMHIYRELLENDLKKNLESKQEIVAKMQAALNIKTFKEMDAAARRLTQEWNEIGPTFKENWEEVRDAFWEAHHKVFDKIKDFYKNQKEQQLENLAKKKELIEKITEINSHQIHTEKSWNKHTKIVIDIQKQWKEIGFAPKTDNDRIWKEFKTQADIFFQNKSEYFLQKKKEYDQNKSIKQNLIEQAEELSKNNDHKYVTKQLTSLQKQWQKTGAAHHRDEQKLWKKFRAVCNGYFEGRKERQKQESVEHKENLEKKNQIIEKLKAVPTVKVEEGFETIESLIKEFNQIGFVPINSKQKLSTDYKNIIHKKLGELGLTEPELSDYLFNVKIKELANAQDPEFSLEKEIHTIKEKIRAVKANILQYENNLGFFKHSKGANPLKQEVEQKIELSKKQLESWQSKLYKVQNILNEE